MEKKTALLIDGSAVVHRAYHALPPFTSSDGTPTNALYGFITMLLSLIDQFKPFYLAVGLDTPKPTFRKKLLPTYQSQRPKAPENLSKQFPLVIEFLHDAHIPCISKEGFEADDVLATLTTTIQHENDHIHTYIVTGDKDILQLVNEDVSVVMPRMGSSNIETMDSSAVHRKLGVLPEQIVDYKALAGDPSDNYTGVPGIGSKKASFLLETYGTLEKIYAHLKDLDTRTNNLLSMHQDSAHISKKLAQLDKNVAIDTTVEDIRYKKLQFLEVQPFLQKYSLKNIEKRLQFEVKTNNTTGKKTNNQLSFF